jgi:hypothetical protein
MEYIKDSNGNIKTILVRDYEERDFKVLKTLSLDTNTKVYLLPQSTEVKLNEDGWLISAKGDKENIWQFLKGWPIPYKCFINGLPFAFKMAEMWNSDKKVEEVPVDKLMWNLNYPWWKTSDDVPYNLTPSEVIENMENYPAHRDRIEKSDIDYPLLLIKTKQNRWLIWDGVHRFIKQILDGKRVVSCQKYTMKDMEEYVTDSYMELFQEWMELEYE